ncbi:MAG: sulfatase-like hydrolase/transferase [Phycisphaerae bacterium]|nr:sulfatase-like hydrolase/transferase [Phycisphaerae bacterium]
MASLNRRGFLKSVGLGVAALAVPGCCTAAAKAASKGKPNIVFIFADDQTYESILTNTSKEIKTPNLHRLMNKGTTFTHAYNMGAWHGAVCVASRAMLNTGRFVWNAHKLDNKNAMQAEQQAGRFWSTMMHKAGYETYFTGKWHVQIGLTSKEKQADGTVKQVSTGVFDNVGHVRAGMPRATKDQYSRPVQGVEGTWTPWDKSKGGYWEGGTHWSEVVGNESIGFIDAAAKKEKPSFMYLAFNAPHDPRQSPKKFVDMYPIEKLELPENYLDVYPYKDAMGCPAKLRDEALAPFPRTPYAVKTHRQEYYAIITHMDQQVGRILDEIEASGKADNTYIFFSADHGLSCGHHGLMGKQNMYDHSVRVPLMVVGPDVPAGKQIDTPVYLQDIMATSLELAGAKNTEHVEFKSLMPLIKGKRKQQYEAIYGCYTHQQRMITLGDYKMIAYPEAQKLRLFNLKDDPQEMKDLADVAKYQVKKQEMFKALVKLNKQMKDVKVDLEAKFAGAV